MDLSNISISIINAVIFRYSIERKSSQHIPEKPEVRDMGNWLLKPRTHSQRIFAAWSVSNEFDSTLVSIDPLFAAQTMKRSRGACATTSGGILSGEIFQFPEDTRGSRGARKTHRCWYRWHAACESGQESAWPNLTGLVRIRLINSRRRTRLHSPSLFPRGSGDLPFFFLISSVRLWSKKRERRKEKLVAPVRSFGGFKDKLTRIIRARHDNEIARWLNLGPPNTPQN